MEIRREKHEKEERQKLTFQPNAIAAKKNQENVKPSGSGAVSQRTFQRIYQCDVEDII